MRLGFNADIFFDFIGRLKLATVVLGLINIILAGCSYVQGDSRDEAFLAFIIIFFIFSLAWVIAVMFGCYVVQDSHIKFDMIYHICACLILLVTGIFFMLSVLKHGTKVDKLGLRIVAMVTGFANSAIYGYLPWKLLKVT